MNIKKISLHQWLYAIISVIILFGISLGIYFLVTGNKPVATDTLSRDTVSVTNISEKTDFYTLDANYPDDWRDYDYEITTWAEGIIDKARTDWKTGGELQLSEAQLSAEFPDRPQMQYSLNIDYTRHNSMKLGTVSYVMENYEFTGGAHGNTGLKTFTFNDEGSLALTDILFPTEENYAGLTKLIKDNLKATLGDYADADMIHDGIECIFDEKTQDQVCNLSSVIKNLENFYITDEGITFVFGQYQVAAYVVGMPEVTLTWSELAPFMNPEFELPLD